MTLTALTFAAEPSANQGDASLYYAYSERLIKGWDWVGRAFQGTVRCKNREFRCGSDQQIMPGVEVIQDRKSTRLNSSHVAISYAVFCLKKKIKHNRQIT